MKLNNTILALVLIMALFISCKKKEETGCAFQPPSEVAASNEVSYIQNYLIQQNISATQHPAGFYYKIESVGNGSVSPTVCSMIRVNYSGSLFNGTEFDYNNSSMGIQFVLGELIAGWKYVLPLVKAGAIVHLYIPPSLGYGNQPITDSNGNVVIPPNSYLYFYIRLLDVQ